MKKTFFLLVFYAILFSTSPVFAFWVWTPETNKWVNPKYAVKDTPQEQLEFALSFYKGKQFSKAINELEKLIKYYPKAREAAEAQYYLGRIYEDMNRLYDAFKAYQKVIEKYPFSDRGPELIKRQYEIGEKMLEGEGKRNKFMTVLTGEEFPVVEVFRTVIKNAPYSKYAAPAQYKIGLFLKSQGLFGEARDEFEKVINDYPDSKWVKAAKYQIALVDARRSSKAPYDQRVTKAAVEEFKEFAKMYPDAELSEKAKKQMESLRLKEAENNFLIGKYYEKTKTYKAAKIYYQTVIEDYKNTPWAVKALERLQALEVEGKLK